MFHDRLPVPLSGVSPLRLVLFGCILGTAAMLSELPNSFFKRQLGIAPGEMGRGWIRVLFYIVDQIDFLVGGWLVATMVVVPSITAIMWSVLFVLAGHQCVTLVGYSLRMRRTAR
jgi:CDP-2,3-bis-(O-geranylgeranyl)-sn-glycerol synthase